MRSGQGWTRTSPLPLSSRLMVTSRTSGSIARSGSPTVLTDVPADPKQKREKESQEDNGKKEEAQKAEAARMAGDGDKEKANEVKKPNELVSTEQCVCKQHAASLTFELPRTHTLSR